MCLFVNNIVYLIENDMQPLAIDWRKVTRRYTFGADWNIYNALYHVSGLSFYVMSINVIDLIVPAHP